MFFFICLVGHYFISPQRQLVERSEDVVLSPCSIRDPLCMCRPHLLPAYLVAWGSTPTWGGWGAAPLVSPCAIWLHRDVLKLPCPQRWVLREQVAPNCMQLPRSQMDCIWQGQQCVIIWRLLGFGAELEFFSRTSHLTFFILKKKTKKTSPSVFPKLGVFFFSQLCI